MRQAASSDLTSPRPRCAIRCSKGAAPKTTRALCEHLPMLLAHRRGSTARFQLCLVALFLVASAACGSPVSSERPVSPEDLRFRVARFSDGVAFSDRLAGRSVTALFGAIRADGKVKVAISLPDDDDGGATVAAPVTGHFDPTSCRLELEAPVRTAGDGDELIRRGLTFDSCSWNDQGPALTVAVAGGPAVSTSAVVTPLYNFVIILTDDQRWDTLFAMPNTLRLAERGVMFESAYTTMPICCPFRASFLAGGIHAHNNNVLTNQWPNGGAERFDDTVTLVTELYRLGYRTGLFGKYMNGLSNTSPRLPAGWTEFAANLPSTNTPERSWSDFYILEGSRWPTARQLRPSSESPESGFITQVTEYSPYYYRDRVLSFLERVDGFPFFLYITPRAPHTPATSAPEDQHLFEGFTYSGRAYGEQDLSDKPAWVRSEAQRFDGWKEERGDLPKLTLQSLQAVDRLVGAVRTSVEQHGLWDDTVFFFTSDSGMQWLEHRLTNKGAPYEESLRVPFIVSAPGIEGRNDEHLVAVNLDIPATVVEYVGSNTRTDGISLRPHWETEGPHGSRRTVFFEHFSLYYPPSVRLDQTDGQFDGRYFSGLRISDDEGEWKYVEHYSGERELYNLDDDPFEEESLHLVGPLQDKVDVLSAEVRRHKGLGITTVRLPEGAVGEPYAFELTAKGGRLPYTWSVIEGRVPGIRTRRQVGPELAGLPPGLVLDATTGRIEGIPANNGSWEFVLAVRDASTSHRSHGHLTYYEHLAIRVRE